MIAAHRTPRGRFSRRSFLAGSAGLLAALAACGGEDGEPGEQPASPTATASYARGDMLIGAEELAEQIDNGQTSVVAFMPADAYESGRIDGAVQVDWPAFEVTDTSAELLEQWRDEVERTLGELGISSDEEVIIYDDGTLFAARLWWILHHLGHPSKRVLNGGFAAWQEAGEPVANQPVEPEPASYRATHEPDVLARLDEVTAALDDDGAVFVDTRSPDEYRAGHIPGAVNIQYTRNAVEETPRLWKSQSDLRRMYEDARVTPDRKIIPYCTTGVRSAVTYFTLRLIGYDDVELFTGSWAEWSNHPDLPVDTG